MDEHEEGDRTYIDYETPKDELQARLGDVF